MNAVKPKPASCGHRPCGSEFGGSNLCHVGEPPAPAPSRHRTARDSQSEVQPPTRPDVATAFPATMPDSLTSNASAPSKGTPPPSKGVGSQTTVAAGTPN